MRVGQAITIQGSNTDRDTIGNFDLNLKQNNHKIQ